MENTTAGLVTPRRKLGECNFFEYYCNMIIYGMLFAGKQTLQEIALNYITQEGSTALCRIDETSTCKYIQNVLDVGNFIRHFRTRHPEVAHKNGLLKDEIIPEKKPRNIPKRPVAMDAHLLIDSVLKMVTYNRLPLECVEWEGFRQILDALGAAVGVTINKTTVKSHLHGITEMIRKEITSEMRHKLISVKIDTASRFHRHILGVNVQYALNGEVVIRTLGNNNRQLCSY